MARTVSKEVGRFYQHYPKIAAIISARAGGKSNAMAAAWHTSISFEPPLYGIAISPKRFTYQLIAISKEFAVNFLPFEKAELIASIGGSTGDKIDKFKQYNIATSEPVKTGAPILEDAYPAYECRLVDDRLYGDHRWLVGEVVAVHIDKEALIEDVISLDKISPALYLGRELYVTTARKTVKYLDREVYGKS